MTTSKAQAYASAKYKSPDVVLCASQSLSAEMQISWYRPDAAKDSIYS